MGKSDKAHNAGLAALLQQLGEGRDCLEKAMALLENLTLKIEIPGISAEEIEYTLDGLVLTLRRTNTTQQQRPAGVPRIIAENSKTRLALGIAETMAQGAENVIIQGETGTGKDLFARYIHLVGNGSVEPFVWCPCGTGFGIRQLEDTFQQVGRGTLLLDDVNDLESSGQGELLKILTASSGQREFRIISTTSCELDSLASKGQFSGALLDLLRGCFVELPALRDRAEDIIPLARHHLPLLCQKNKLPAKQMSPEYLQLCELYPWPGNVRELINVLEQSLYTAGDKKTLFGRDLPTHVRIQTAKGAAQRKKGL